MSLHPPPLSSAILTAPQPPSGLTLQTVRVPKETTYFNVVLVLSILVWAAIAVSIVGLFYAVMIGFFLWVSSGLLTAYLRAEAVRVSSEQLPELHAAFLDVCQRLGVPHPPLLYVLQSGGLLNAFATRFAGRDFVVVYSDMLEALGARSPEMRFILGHEIGHIQSRHILKQIFLAPGLFCPLVGPAYRRAWETTCDRYGALAAHDTPAAVRAMLVLCGGRENGQRLNPAAFARQHADERGFFVSLHELTSTYPTLSRRVTELMALSDGRTVAAPKRHPLAYLLALGMPGGNVGGSGPLAGMLFMVVFIGLMAAMAIPAFEKVRQSSMGLACVNQQRQLEAALEQYRLEHGKGATDWEDVTGPAGYLAAMPLCPSNGEYHGGYDETTGYSVNCSVETHDRARLAALRGR